MRIMIDDIDTVCYRLKSLGQGVDDDLTNYLTTVTGIECIQRVSLSVSLFCMRTKSN